MKRRTRRAQLVLGLVVLLLILKAAITDHAFMPNLGAQLVPIATHIAAPAATPRRKP